MIFSKLGHLFDYLWAVWAFILGAVFKREKYQTRAYGSGDAIIGLRYPNIANFSQTNMLLDLWMCPALSETQFETLRNRTNQPDCAREGRVEE